MSINMDERTILRTNKRNNPYLMVDKTGLNDEHLSWKAKGLLCYILSLPDNWKIYLNELKNHSTDGRDSTASALKELIKYGYCTRETNRDEKGHFKGFIYNIYEVPIDTNNQKIIDNTKKEPKTDNPFLGIQDTDNPETDNPKMGNPPLLNNNNNNNNNNKSVSQSIEEKMTDGQTDNLYSLSSEINNNSDDRDISNIIVQAQVDNYDNENLRKFLIETLKEAYKKNAKIVTLIKPQYLDFAIYKYKQAQQGKEIKNIKKYFVECILSSIQENETNNSFFNQQTKDYQKTKKEDKKPSNMRFSQREYLDEDFENLFANLRKNT